LKTVSSVDEKDDSTWKGGRINESVRCVVADNPSPMTNVGTNSWVVSQRDTGNCYLIDPGPNSSSHIKALIAACEQDELHISAILLTHDHPDHGGSAKKLSGITKAPVFSKRTESLQYGPFQLEESCPYLEVISLKGHSRDSVGFVFPETRSVFTGDTLFKQSPTMISWPDGKLEDYFESLENLAQLMNTKGYLNLLTGHGEPVDEPLAIIEHTVKHRQDRLSAVKDSASNSKVLGIRRTWEDVYFDGNKMLSFAARINVLAQLKYLQKINDPSVEGKEYDLYSRFMIWLMTR